MKEFSSIGALKEVVHFVRKRYEGHPLPTLTFQGTVKLHGTNAGVRVTHSDIRAQKRSAVVDIGNDNFGFAAFVHSRFDTFRELAELFFGQKLKKLDDITFFGEWVGSNIQKGVAVANCPKHFVIFGAWVQRHGYVDISEITEQLKNIPNWNEQGIWFINQIPTYEIEVDFADPMPAQVKLSELTIEVETQCPWGSFMGVNGIGEGIVWTWIGEPGNSEFWFKTKGLKHKDNSLTTKVIVPADPVKVANIAEFVKVALPEWRLEQGLKELEQNGKDITVQNVGAYLQWVCKDILKEESDTLTSNGLDWKDVVKSVNTTSRQFYLTEVERRAFDPA